MSGKISEQPRMTSPDDADLVPIVQSAAPVTLKTITWANLVLAVKSALSWAAITATLASLGNASTRNVGTAADTVCAGDDARLSNSRKCDGTFDNPGTARASLALTSAAITAVGTAANQLVQLDANAKLPAVDGSQLTGIAASQISGLSTADIAARDHVALLCMRMMLADALTPGGKFWALATDVWSANNTNAALIAGSPNYYANYYGTYTSITAAGMTQYASAYTFGTGTISYNSASNAAYGFQSTSALLPSGDFDLNFTLGSTYASSYDGFMFGVSSAAMSNLNYQPTSASSGLTTGWFVSITGTGTANQTIKLWSNQTVLTTLSNQTVNSGDKFVIKRRSGALTLWQNGSQIGTFTGYSNTAAAYIIGGNYGNAGSWSGVTYGLQTVANATMISDAVSVSSAPTKLYLYFLQKDDSGSATMGTDMTVEGSRDGGTTYTAASTYTNILGVAGYDGTYTLWRATVDVSAQPSDTSLKARIKTLNTKLQRFTRPLAWAA